MEEQKSNKIATREAIVFIDGNNLYHNLNALGITPGRVNLYKLAQLVCKHFNSNYKRAFYYNSVPSIDDGSELYSKHMGYLNKVGSYPNFEVITRKLQRHSNEEKIEEKKKILSELSLCNKCSSIVEKNCMECLGTIKKKEKGIDVNIAIDMLNLSVFKNECDLCILISGDADFIPVMDLIKEQEKDVVSAFLPFGYSCELRQKHGWFILHKDLIIKKCLD
ncbi:MAG: hypothetical protein US54_C0079G0013 [Candidatus Roizmanbacteria bacterium GW2011_GWA2_37_7]|uniref:NYN domain-containing protein n=1 Tax=Candidatus Roizmanbacteria bacterium GW2011_GWA2_37_7 TaxID=1618481 RepID=A0A0G0H1Y4_9BACT|nr:MAG: hypothetical protein US54_C0079G0013 [Candidatus Roizmanbacteria bacterium GW2011_GWA2_37_7]